LLAVHKYDSGKTELKCDMSHATSKWRWAPKTTHDIPKGVLKQG